MHYYINGSRTGDGKCSGEFDNVRAELLRMIMEKASDSDIYQLREAARAMGIVASWCGIEDDEVVVGSDIWNILECSNYGCRDTARGVDW